MKNKILILVIGILIGAIITTLGFLIYTKVMDENLNKPQIKERGQMQQPSNGNMGERPEKPNRGDRMPTEIPSDSSNNI